MKNRRLAEAAGDAIEDLFSDSSVPLETTLEALKDLRGDIDIKIAALQGDLKRIQK